MSISFVRDSNGEPLRDIGGLRPDFAHIKRVTTGASITELDISALNTAADRNEGNSIILRIAAIGTNNAYFSLGPAATLPADNTTMLHIGANTVSYFKATSGDVSLYHVQDTGTTSLEICAMV